MICKGAEIEATDPKGNTPFLLASRCGVTDIVQTLIDAGSNVKALTNKKMGALEKSRNH